MNFMQPVDKFSRWNEEANPDATFGIVAKVDRVARFTGGVVGGLTAAIVKVAINVFRKDN